MVNVGKVTKHFPANVMRRMLFGTRHFGKDDNNNIGEPAGPKEEEHVSALFTLLLHIYAFCASDYLPWLRMLDLDGHRRAVRGAMKVVRKLHDPILDDRLKQWREGKRTEPEDLLDVFISLKGSDGKPLLSVQEIRAQVTVRFFVYS